MKLDVNGGSLCVWFNSISLENYSFISLVSLIKIANMNRFNSLIMDLKNTLITYIDIDQFQSWDTMLNLMNIHTFTLINSLININCLKYNKTFINKNEWIYRLKYFMINFKKLYIHKVLQKSKFRLTLIKSFFFHFLLIVFHVSYSRYDATLRFFFPIVSF